MEINTEKEFKNFLTSKTLWVNFVALIAMLVQNKWGFVVDGEIQATILIIINAILRLITKKPVSWKVESDKIKNISLGIIVLLLMTSCGFVNRTFGPKESICNSLENSAICYLAEKAHTSPEAISNSFLAVNTIALSTGLIEKRDMQEAVDFTVEVIVRLEKYKAIYLDIGETIDAMDAINYIESNYKALPKGSRELMQVITDNYSGLSLKVPFIEEDFNMLIYHFNKEKELLSSFL